MNIQDLLQLSLSQIRTIQTNVQGTVATSDTQFATSLQTALTAVSDALQTVAAETGTTTATTPSAAVSGTTASGVQATAPAVDTATLLAVSQQSATTTTTAATTDANQVSVPQKGANGYYNQDPRPADPVAPANIHSADIQQQITAYDHDQMALVVWQQKEIAMANTALRQRGAYDWEGSPLRPQPGSGDWQSEFTWRIQAMRDQGLPVDDYLANVSMS